MGFAVKNELLGKIETPAAVSSRLMRLRLSLKSGFVSIVCAYAPTLAASNDVKDEFYDGLSAVLHQIPNSEKLILLGDFNAGVGSDNSAWPSCLGKHGIGKVIKNGQRLLELCAQFQLYITGTFFADKHHRKVSWRHPRSRHWHQLDHIITRRHDLPDVNHTRTFHSANCDTDHSFVCSKFKLTPKKLFSTKQQCKPRINVTNTSDKDRCQQFSHLISKNQDLIEQNGTIDDCWSKIKSHVQNSALAVFGKKVEQKQRLV